MIKIYAVQFYLSKKFVYFILIVDLSFYFLDKKCQCYNDPYTFDSQLIHYFQTIPFLVY